jgi:hypothetical protein
MPLTESPSFYAPQLDISMNTHIYDLSFVNVLHFYLVTSCLHIFGHMYFIMSYSFFFTKLQQ